MILRYQDLCMCLLLMCFLGNGCSSDSSHTEANHPRNEKSFSLLEISGTQGYEPGAVHSVYGIYSHSNPNAFVYRNVDISKLVVAYQESDFASDHVTGCDSYLFIVDLFTLEQSGPFKIGDTQAKGDPHGGPAIFLDSAGYVHIFYGSHHSSQLWTRSKKMIWDEKFLTGSKYSMSDFESPKAFGENHTYPQVVYAQNKVWLFTRGPLTNTCYNLYVQTCSEPQRSWNELNMDSLVQLTEFSGYLGASSGAVLLRSEPVTDPNGDIHIMFSWRDNHHLESGSETRPLCYARYCAMHARWERSNGAAYELPITPETAEFISYESGVVCEPRGKANGMDSFGDIYVLFFFEENAFLIKGHLGTWAPPVQIAPGNFGALAVDDDDRIHLYINSPLAAPEPYIAHFVSYNHGMTFEFDQLMMIASKAGDSYLTDHFLIFSREIDEEMNMGVVDIINLNFF